jgi:hypothetical protein
VGIERAGDCGEGIEEAVCAQAQAMLAAVSDMCAIGQMIEQQQPEIRAGTGHELTLLRLGVFGVCVVEVCARVRDQLGQRTQPTYTARRISFETVDHGELTGRCMKRA